MDIVKTRKLEILKYTGFLITAGLLLSGCRSTLRYPASGQLHGEDVSTTLDSPIAAYYLNNYLQGKRSDPAFDAAIEILYHKKFDRGLPNHDELLQISERHSVDFAALFLSDLVANDPDSTVCRTYFNYYLRNPDSALISDTYNRYMILFVPGWDYIESGHLTGSDLAQPRHLITELGIENRLVKIDANGSVEENASLIVKELIRSSTHAKRTIIAGASSAGPAIYLALGEIQNRELPAPVAWINLGGIIQGSPLYEHYKKFTRSWFMNILLLIKGWRAEAVASMGTEASRRRFRQYTLPPETLVINYVGLSLSGQLSKYSKKNTRF
ncbi:MAG: hypothetical protein O3C20_20530 [Verrucomicrobia bacterium]|nr:hypothetical protein [Verrucomicrobiota bacterium]